MIGIRNMVKKFTTDTKPSTPQTARKALPNLNPFKPNWERRMDKISEKIEAVEREIAALEDQRADAALRAEAGDDKSKAAASELFDIHKRLHEARQRLSDLQAARGAAGRKVEEERAEAAAQARAEQERAIKAAHKRYAAAVKAADAALDKLAGELDKAAEASHEIINAAGTTSIAPTVGDVFARVPEAVKFRLRGYGLQGSPFIDATQATLTRYVPPADFVVGKARPPQPPADSEAA